MVDRPKVSEQTWERIYHTNIVSVYESQEHHGFYYRVNVEGKRPKYFWGETAWADYQRYAYDQVLANTL